VRRGLATEGCALGVEMSWQACPIARSVVDCANPLAHFGEWKVIESGGGPPQSGRWRDELRLVDYATMAGLVGDSGSVKFLMRLTATAPSRRLQTQRTLAIKGVGTRAGRQVQ